jgi:Transcriptional regulator
MGVLTQQSKHYIKPKTDKGVQTLNRLCTAAEKLFHKQGYHATTIVQITTKAKVSNGTFYIYFKDKLSLYKYMLEQYSHEIRKASSMAAAHYSTYYEKEFHGFKAYLEYVIKHPGAFILISESLYVEPEFYKEYYDHFSTRYKASLASGIENGEILDCDLTTAAYMLSGTYTFLSMKYVLFDKRKSISDDEVEKLFRIWKQGLFAMTEALCTESLSPSKTDCCKRVESCKNTL